MTSNAALCATEIRWTGDLWFSTDPAEREQAKTICRRCPIREACAQAGLDAGHKARGVWGGLSSGDRRVIRTGRLDGPDPDDEGEQARVPVLRPRRPCGDHAAFMAHRRYGETCEVCQAAHDARVEADRWRRLAEEHAKGGTGTGAVIHRRLGERACWRCRAGAARDRARRNVSARAEGAQAWAAATGAAPAGSGPQTAVEAAA